MSFASDSSSDVESGSKTESSGKCLLVRNSTKRSSVGDELTERLHSAVWPCCEPDLLARLLKENPKELNKKFGIHQDTLLHR